MKNFLLIVLTFALAPQLFATRIAQSPKDTMLNFVFRSPPEQHVSNALYIMQGDKLLLEEYQRGYKASSRHYAWSISKTLTGTMIGAAVQKGDINLKDSIEKYLGPIGYQDLFDKNPKLKQITVEHLMEWGSGLNYSEEYEHAESRTDSSVIQQLYSKLSTKDSLRYILSHEVEAQPGTRFRYTTGDSTLLMGVLKGAYPKHQTDFPWKLLFEPLGMQETTFETDEKGTFVGGAFAYLTARDLAKVGQLYLNGGVYQGQQILPPNWNKYCWKIGETYQKTDKSKIGLEFQMPGRQWWLNIDRKKPEQVKFPNTPADTYMGIGHWGQYLIVIPSKNIVAVRFGEDKQGQIDKGILINQIVRYVEAPARDEILGGAQ